MFSVEWHRHTRPKNKEYDLLVTELVNLVAKSMPKEFSSNVSLAASQLRSTLLAHYVRSIHIGRVAGNSQYSVWTMHDTFRPPEATFEALNERIQQKERKL